MTVISDYTSLQTAVVEYLARDQDTTLIARVPTFIQFFEAKMNRGLFVRQMEQRSTATLTSGVTDAEFVLLPSDFQSMRRVRLSSVSGKPHLDFRSGTQLDEFRTSSGNAVNQPQYFTIIGIEMELAPTPDQNYTIEMVYRQNLPALASNSSNWLLTMAPDLYLYGALLESAPYLKEDTRIQVWGAGYKNALDELNNLNLTAAFNASPMAVRSTGVTP